MRVNATSTFLACGLSLIAAGVARASDIVATEQATSGLIVRSSDVTGLAVYNNKNERLGKIENLVIDFNAGKIRYAVLSFGGVLGMGDKYFAVPWQDLTFVNKGLTSAGTPKESYCVLDVHKDSLKKAPGFDKDRWPDFANADWQQRIEQYYHARSASKEGTTR